MDATQTFTITNSETPTMTSTPTNTLSPTRTKFPPTSTIQAPNRVSELLENVRVINFDNFDDVNTYSILWDKLSPGIISSGVMKLFGKEWMPCSYTNPIIDGQGIIIDLSYNKGANFEFIFINGAWGTSEHKRFGVYIYGNSIVPDLPPRNIGKGSVVDSFYLKPDTTYTIMMLVLQKGEFMAFVWDPTKSDKVITYHRIIGEVWSGYKWTFNIGGSKGTLLLDNFKAIEFTGVKTNN
jgi:hypothetical protein